MECNKEEAVRARELAEKKLVQKDYKIALKLSLKAQNLYPDLENLTQLLTVCSVHCSAIDKINGETDWYGVLQVGTTADEIAIKKQYRKLALLLHPDKNKFPGAEAAFKLIGEANGILIDRGKRSLHDVKRNGTIRVNNNNNTHVRRPPAPRTGQTGQTGDTFWTICHSCGMRYQYFRNIYKKALRCQNCLQAFVAYDINEQPVHTSNPNPNTSFNMRFSAVNGSGPEANPFQRYPSPFCSQFQSTTGTSSGAGTGTKENVRFQKVNLEKPKPPPAGRNFAKKTVKSSKPQNKKRKRVIEEDEEESEADSTESEEEIVLEKEVKTNNRTDPPRRSSRQKQDVKYNEKDPLDDDLDDDLDDGNEEEDDEEEEEVEEEIVNRKRLRKGSDKEKEEIKADEEMEKDVEMDNEKYIYQDPEFFPFDELRSMARFTVDQVWAVYDDQDGMPRFYARIKNIYTTPKFRLRYVWLESDPLTQPAKDWTRAELPVACGAYKTGISKMTEELLMFSHEVEYSKGGTRNTFEIYPKKGEIWALFKNWDANWSADPHAHRGIGYEYEVVEVVSDFSEGTGFVVVSLVKINGFLCLFMHSKEKAPFVVPVTETLRFSHQVPSYRTKGDEREGVPEGAFELDPASLPNNPDKVFASIDLDPKPYKVLNENMKNGNSKEKLNENLKNNISKETPNENLKMVNSKEKQNENVINGNSKEKLDENLRNANTKEKQNENSKNANSKEKLKENLKNANLKEKLNENPKNANSKEKQNLGNGNSKEKLIGNLDAKSDENLEERTEENSASDSSPSAEYTAPEFYDFAIDRTVEKFQAGQVWALYCSVDQLPKYYACINRLDALEEKVQIRWLEAVSEGLTGEAKRWVDQELPIGCGLFILSGKPETYDCIGPFSHLVRTVSCTTSGKKNRFEIIPVKDEIWALYRNWTVGWGLNDIKEKCQYDLVQVTEVTGKGIRVEILAKVDGYSTVFARDRSRKRMMVPKGEYMRFSHMIPSYRLEEEKGGKLKGCFELDLAAVPENLL